jgi:hypothetical protein
MSSLKVQGNASGTATHILQSANTNTNLTQTLPSVDNVTLGYLNIPPVGTKITIPDATFSEGDAIVIANNTSGSITITCSITTAYIAGTDSDKATMSLATRGVASILFLSGTVCIVSGNVS